MDPDPNLSQTNQDSAGFNKKPVQSPITGNSLSQPPALAKPWFARAAGGIKDFYLGNKIYFWAIFLAAVIIGTLSFFAFRKSPAVAPKQANVQVTIQAPDTVANGADVVYKIKVENLDSQKLVNLQLELAYPDGLSYTSSSPGAANLSGSLFTVPDLISGQNAVVIVKAKASGNINDAKTLRAVLHYHYNNFNSEFTAQQEFTVRLTASDVALSLSGPATTNNAELVVYSINYQNNSSSDIKNAHITFNAPDGFNLGSANPPADLSNNTWVINSLAQGAQGSIEIHGTFSSANPGESKTASADFLVLGSDGQYFIQGSANFITAIASVPLLATQSLQQDNGTAVVNPGDTLNVVIHFQNNASVPATGVNVVVSLDGKALDLSTIQAEGAQVSGNSIIWNAASNVSLETLTPNEAGNLGFSVRVKNPATKDSSKNLSLSSSVKIKSNEYQDYFSGGSLNLKISSPSNITTALDYLSGSLPPQAGKVTAYRVSLILRNSTNDFNNGVVTAFIPLGPGGFDPLSVNAAESGNVDYDPATGKLTWNFASLPAHTGQFSQPKTLQFTLRFTPSSSQTGQSPVLVKTIEMDANDTFTNQPVQNQADDITTRDVSGNNSNNGIVNP